VTYLSSVVVWSVTLKKVVAYYRVSTERQGRSGLGLEAQEHAVQRHCEHYGYDLIAGYHEVETAAKDELENRPALQRAIAHATRSKATLIIAKLDRLSRSVYVTALLHRSNIDFLAVDMPGANRMSIQFLAVVAEGEARAISGRTKSALAALKARGVRLGAHRPECRNNLTREAADIGRRIGSQRVRDLAREAYADLSETMRSLRTRGESLRAIAEHLNADGHTTRRGTPWSAVQVRRILAREPCP